MLKLTPFEETVAGKQYIEEGLRQGIEQGVLVARKDDVLKALQVRFQQTGDLTSQQVRQIDSLEQLSWLFDQALTTATFEEFEQRLQEVTNN